MRLGGNFWRPKTIDVWSQITDPSSPIINILHDVKT